MSIKDLAKETGGVELCLWSAGPRTFACGRKAGGTELRTVEIRHGGRVTSPSSAQSWKWKPCPNTIESALDMVFFCNPSTDCWIQGVTECIVPSVRLGRAFLATFTLTCR